MTTTLFDQIKAYEKRATTEYTHAKMYPYDQVSTYEVISGSNDLHPRNTIGILHGRFIDVLAASVSLPGYGGAWCSPDMGNDSCGYVQAYVPPTIIEVPAMPGLIENLTLARELETKIAEYQSTLAQITSTNA